MSTICKISHLISYSSGWEATFLIIRRQPHRVHSIRGIVGLSVEDLAYNPQVHPQAPALVNRSACAKLGSCIPEKSKRHTMLMTSDRNPCGSRNTVELSGAFRFQVGPAPLNLVPMTVISLVLFQVVPEDPSA